jgi:hypothetical protein
VFDPPDLTNQGLMAAQLGAMRLEALKGYAKGIEKMKEDRPKLYGLIWEKMSVESRDEVSQDAEFEEWSTDADPERLWQAMVRTHKIDCVSDVGEIKELAARKAYTGIKQGAFETLAQYTERFHETYKGYKNTGTVEAPIVVAPKIQALDFFHGLDPGRYGAFKTNMLNGWNLRSIALPETPNEIYRIAGSWVKPVSRIEGHMAAMYMTVEEEEEAFVMMLEQETPSKNKRQGKKPQKDLSHIKCFACNRMGHYANKCPNKKALEEEDEDEAEVHGTWHEEQEAAMYMTTVSWADEEETVCRDCPKAVHATEGLLLTEVLLDNQANINIVHPMLLEDIRPSPRKIKVNGVGGKQLIVDKMGMLPGFFRVYTSEETKANVLCFSDVEDMYEISYEHRKAFVVHMGEKEIVFEWREKLYVADWCPVGTVAATVQENEMLYSREHVKRTKEAYDFLKNSGYPSLSEAVHLLNDGNVRGGPQLLRGDVERAYKIYGTHPEYVRGKMTRKMVGRVPIDPTLRSIEKILKVYADVMHIDTKKFLISVADPLHLMLQSQLESEARTPLGMALQGQLALLRSRGFIPSIVYTDPHSTFRSMTQDFPGVEIDVGGWGLRSEGRCQDSTYQGNGLSWSLPKCLVAELVVYVVSRLNIRRTSALSENVCPRVLFSGVPINYKKELSIAFGDYVEAYEGTDNTSRARSAACIALYPANNAAGSWVLWKIDTRSKVHRTNFEKLVTTDLVKETIGRIADEQEREMEQPVIPLNAAATVEEDNDATQQSTSETDDSEGPRNDPHEDEIDLINESEEEAGSQVQVEEEEPRETGGQARPTSTTRTG